MKYDIYRCASSRTIEVVAELRELGVRAWVPLMVLRQRLPRSRKRITVTRCAVPGYVFVPPYSISRLDRASLPLWTRLAPLWTTAGAHATCGHGDLTAMQEAINGTIPNGLPEEKTPVDLAREMVGKLVTITTGPFSGFGGVVVGYDQEGRASVDLKKSLGILKIPPCVLTPISDMGGTSGDHPHI